MKLYFNRLSKKTNSLLREEEMKVINFRACMKTYVYILPLLSLLIFSNSADSSQKNNQWNFIKIADADTNLPNWPPGGNKLYLFPSLEGDTVSFLCSIGGSGWPFFCVYTKALNGDFIDHVDKNTPMPGSAGNFSGVNYPSMGDGMLAFYGIYAYSPTSSGIFKKALSSHVIHIVANDQTYIPGGVGKFGVNGFYAPSTKQGNIVFCGSDNPLGTQQGIYAEINGSLIVLADKNTTIPNHPGIKYESFSTAPTISDGYISYIGQSTTPSLVIGLYRYSIAGGFIEVIADENTDVPNGTGKFVNFIYPSMDGKDIAFVGGESGTNKGGVFTCIDDNLDVVVMKDDPIPGTGILFYSFGYVSIDNGKVVFVGYGPPLSNYSGIITNIGGSLARVIDTNDILDGKSIYSFFMTNRSLDDNNIVFRVVFTDFTSAIYLAVRSSLTTDSNEISASTGGSVNFTLNADAENADRNYLIPGGISGTSPGQLLPGGKVTLPVNFDSFTYNVVFPLINTPMFKDFMGTLDSEGKGAAQLNLPQLSPDYVGIKMYYAYCLNKPFDFVSNPVDVEIVP